MQLDPEQAAAREREGKQEAVQGVLSEIRRKFGGEALSLGRGPARDFPVDARPRNRLTSDR
jgi:hypothetical protein